MLLGVVALMTGWPLESGIAMAALATFVIAGSDVKALEERLADLTTRADEINAGAEKETRDLNEAEQTEWRSIMDEITKVEAALKDQRTLDSAKANQANKKHTREKEEDKITKRFSFVNAINSAVELKRSGKMPEGLIAEMHQEAEIEAKRSSLTLQGIGIPQMVLRGNTEQRDLTATGTTTTTGDQGGVLIPSSQGEYIDVLYNRMKVFELGARRLTGLSGNVDISRKTAASAAVWEGENDSNTESTITFEKATLTPHRLSAMIQVSKQLLMQGSPDAEAIVRQDMQMAQAIAVDAAAISGSGVGDIPAGILNTSGIGSVVGGTNGAVPTFGNIIDLETAIANANADVANMGYITTPGIKGYLKKTSIVDGQSEKIWPIGATGLNGYRAEVSNQMPSTGTKGTAEDICHALLFGNWDDLVVAQWDGLDIIVDPYTQKRTAMIEVNIDSWWDILVRRAASFAAMVDALVS